MSSVAANGDLVARPVGDADVPRAFVGVARVACGVLAAADVGFVVWMILAGRQGLWPAVYALCLAAVVVAGMTFAFLAAYGRANRRPLAFARVALGAAWGQAGLLGVLVFHGWLAGELAAGAAGPRVGLLGLTAVAIVAASLIPHRRQTVEWLTQLSHRAIALGVTLAVARLAIPVWRRTFAWLDGLGVGAFALFALAALSSLAATYASRDRREAFAEAYRLTLVGLAFALVTLGLLAVGYVASSPAGF